MGLHYAAAIADHDDRGMYDWLTDEFSADEGKLDKVIDKLMSLSCFRRILWTKRPPSNNEITRTKLTVGKGIQHLHAGQQGITNRRVRTDTSPQ